MSLWIYGPCFHPVYWITRAAQQRNTTKQNYGPSNLIPFWAWAGMYVSLSRMSWSYQAHDPSDLSPTFRWLLYLIIIRIIITRAHHLISTFLLLVSLTCGLQHRPTTWRVHMSWTKIAFCTCAGSKDAGRNASSSASAFAFPLLLLLSTPPTQHHSTAVRIFQAWDWRRRGGEPSAEP